MSHSHELATSGDGSVRSSEEGTSDFNVTFGDDVGDERGRIERKMNAIRERLSRINLEREAELEDFLRITEENSKLPIDNPQLVRIRQHFEKKNKRHAQETERLQKKLAQFQQKLDEISSGTSTAESSFNKSTGNVFSNVGHGIRRTGANIKEMTETVMSAPIEFAHRIKGTFGSADNINDQTPDVSNVGQSRFYQSEQQESAESAHSDVKKTKSQTLPPGMRMDMLNPREFDTLHIEPLHHPATRTPTVNSISNEVLMQLHAEVRALREQNDKLSEQIVVLQQQVNADMRDFRASNGESQAKHQRMEEVLNETVELHQAEVQQLKNELANIANRLDYQYNDRFKRVEESVEGVRNQMTRMEASVRDMQDGSMHSGATLNRALLSGANILVEVLKIILFLTSAVLDFLRPFTGTRTRSGIFLLIIFIAVLVFQNVNFGALFYKKENSTALPTTPSPK